MRNFKYRIWDKELNFFADPTVYFIGLDGSAWFNNCADGKDSMCDQSDKLVIMECTGLKDVSGKDIYEGDILEFDKKEWGGSDNVFVVSFDEDEGEWDTGGGHNTECKEYKKVVGNIFENPEITPAT